MGRLSVRPILVEYVTDRVGEVVHLHTMISDTGLNKAQIQQGMLRLTEAGFVDVILSSNAWIHRGVNRAPTVDHVNSPAAVEVRADHVKAVAGNDVKAGELVKYIQGSGDLMQIVKCLNGGKVLLQDAEGILYVATKLEV